jgi:hypothetical protein
MRKIKIKRSFLLIFIALVLSVSGCIKETYNMNMLSKKTHLSPTLAISAVKGDISFSDAVKPNDTIVFDQNKLVTFVFKRESIIDLQLSDFTKGTVVKTAVIDPGTFDLDIHDVLSHISGDFKVISPSIKFSYTNAFPDSVKINLKASASRNKTTLNLNLLPFGLVKPNLPAQPAASAVYMIDKNNSNISDLISLPPEIINYSGTVTLTSSTKSDSGESNALTPPHLTGSLEIDIPMELKINNLQFTDTVDNFIKNDKPSLNDPADPANFDLLRVNLSAKNGFPLGVSVRMSLYDSAAKTIKSTVDAVGILTPAPVDSNGKVTGVSESTAVIEFTQSFFSNVNKTDKIIFRFTLNSTGNGAQDVKIYSDYRLNFSAALVVKPDINL